MERLLQLVLCCAIFLPATVFAVSPNPDLMKKWEQEGVLKKRMAMFAAKQAGGYDKVSKSFPATGTNKVLVVLVNYSDTSFDSGSTPTYYKTLFETGTGLTWKKYYSDMSNGKLTLSFDIYGPYNVSKTHSYYGGTAENGDDDKTAELCGEAVTALIADKNATVDFSQYDNDKDGYVDGIILIHQGSGQETSATPADIWSAAGYITEQTADSVKFKSFAAQPEYGKTAGDSTIGVFCHEFGHVLGLPDTYDTTYTTAGVGQWSLMADGSWNGPTSSTGSVPAPLLAWERAQLGWLTPATTASNPLPVFPSAPVAFLFLIVFAGTASFFLRTPKRWIAQAATAIAIIPCMILFSPGCGSSDDAKQPVTTSYTIQDVNTSYQAYKVPLQTTSINSKDYSQYLLVENIVKTAGTWAEYLPGDGLLITKIDEFFISVFLDSNSINGAKSGTGAYYRNHGVNVMEAGYTEASSLWYNSSNRGLSSDTYPNGTNNSIGPDLETPFEGPNTNYTAYSSTGTFKTFYSANSGVTISDISAKGSSMTFKVTR